MTFAFTVNMWVLLIVAPILLMYVTWVFFTAVMRLRELRDSGVLTNKSNPVVWWLALFTLGIGLVLDFILNITVCTAIGLELPKETLTTFRLCRWYESPPDSWWNEKVRRPFAHFGALLLNMVDTDGKHIY